MSVLKSVAGLGAALVLAFPALADPREDAEYVAEAMFGEAVVQEMFGALGEMMVPLMMGEMQRNGVVLTEPGSRALSQMLMKSILNGLGSSVTEMYADIYEEVLAPDDLAAYRAFLETPSGRALAKAQPRIVFQANLLGEELGMDVALIAMDEIEADIRAGNWPDGTSAAVKNELRELFAK